MILTRAMVLHPLLQPEEANQRVRVFAMIETAEAIRNIDSILDVPGLDGIFVGIISLLLCCLYEFQEFHKNLLSRLL